MSPFAGLPLFRTRSAACSTRKFETKLAEDKYLRVERTYGSFSRSFSLANTVNSEAIKADYHDGVLTLSIPKREEAKPKQIKISCGGQRKVSSKTVGNCCKDGAGDKPAPFP